MRGQGVPVERASRIPGSAKRSKGNKVVHSTSASGRGEGGEK